MANPDTNTDAPLDAVESVALPVANEEAFDEAAFIAGLDATPATEADSALATTEESEASEAIDTAADDKTDAKPPADAAKPATESDVALAKARRILASASKKERGVADAVAKAEQGLIDLFNSNPNAFFDRAGKSFKQWLQDIGTGPVTAEPKEEDRVTALEQRLLDQDLKAQQAEVTRLVDGIHTNIRNDAKTFPRINRSGSHSMVTDLMVEYHNTHGAPLPYRKAAAQVEEYLRTLAAEPKDSTPAVKASSKDTKPTSRPGQTTLTNDSIRSQPPSSDVGEVDERVREQTIMRELGLFN